MQLKLNVTEAVTLETEIKGDMKFAVVYGDRSGIVALFQAYSDAEKFAYNHNQDGYYSRVLILDLRYPDGPREINY